MNSVISGHTLTVDSSLGETAPPLHWSYKSIRLTWPSYEGTDHLGYVLQRIDYLYARDANADEGLITDTTAVRPNHTSASKTWHVYRLKPGGEVRHCRADTWNEQYCVGHARVTIRCGDYVSARGDVTVEFLTNNIGPENMPDELPYPAGTWSNHRNGSRW